MRTHKKVEAMVDRLEKQKKTLPQYNFFGEDNHAQIDIQIEIIKEEKYLDELFETEEDTNILQAAETANDWLECEVDDDELINE